jgi:hypothetical protein
VAGYRPNTLLTMWYRPDSHTARLIAGLTFGTFTTPPLLVDLPLGLSSIHSVVAFPSIPVGSVLLRHSPCFAHVVIVFPYGHYLPSVYLPGMFRTYTTTLTQVAGYRPPTIHTV